MGNAGTLRATLTANTAQFDAAMKKSSGEVEKFGTAANHSKEHAAGFNAHMLGSRAAISTFANVVGVSSSSLMHFAHAFEFGGIAIGGIIATILILKDVMEANAEAAKKEADQLREIYELTKKINELKGIKSAETDPEKKRREEIEKLGSDIISQRQVTAEAQGSWRRNSNIASIKEDADADAREQERKLKFMESNLGELRDKKLPFERQAIAGGGGSATAQSIGERAGVFAIEHGQNQITLLQQIANNTAKAAGGDTPVSGR